MSQHTRVTKGASRQPPRDKPIVVDGPIHGWFGLTYANYLVLPRSVLQSMADEWQERFVACLDELQAASRDLPHVTYDVRCLPRPPEHITESPCSRCDGEGGSRPWQDHIWVPCDECDGDGVVEEDCWETPEEVGIITDPIPHYNRGRTRIDLA